jgi:hypothetical protein
VLLGEPDDLAPLPIVWTINGGSFANASAIATGGTGVIHTTTGGQ